MFHLIITIKSTLSNLSTKPKEIKYLPDLDFIITSCFHGDHNFDLVNSQEKETFEDIDSTSKATFIKENDGYTIHINNMPMCIDSALSLVICDDKRTIWEVNLDKEKNGYSICTDVFENSNMYKNVYCLTGLKNDGVLNGEVRYLLELQPERMEHREQLFLINDMQVLLI